MTPKAQSAEDFKSLLQEARTLADFSNSNDGGYFRQNYPDFVPQSWWEGAVVAISIQDPRQQRSLPTWKREQEEIRATWSAGFPLENSIRLISHGVDSSRTEEALRGFTEDQNAMMEELKINPKFVRPEPKVYPYQRAVMFLAVHSWRARHCSVCGNRFVAAEPKQGTCSDTCRQQAERNRKNAWWSKSGKKQRQDKQKQLTHRGRKTH
jgi:hypothetical protein